MNFNSLSFAIFLPIVFIVYWAVPFKFKTFILLISSYYFYMSWNAKYVFLIFGTTFASYLSAILIEQQSSYKKKKIVLILCTVACLGVLFFFKYFNFFFESITVILNAISLDVNPIVLKLLLPVGISFYTFQTISYVVDVYRGEIEPEKDFITYATFVSFFPQLVAGPIERTKNLLPQIKSDKQFDYAIATDGVKLMAWGFYKKLVVADTLAYYVDIVYANPQMYSGFDLALAVFFFTIQIYCDFSGYSDIAIGTAKLLGINLMQNFNCPYYSTSIKEFWSRWHISLSTWFRDYLYIPLGGSRCRKTKAYSNTIITFLVSGLWHGANWTFIVWGGLHGVAQVIEKMGEKYIFKLKTLKIGRFISWLAVFLFCNITWVFFRANSISQALYIILHSVNGITNPLLYVNTKMGIKASELVRIIIAISILFVIDGVSMKKDILKLINSKPGLIRYSLYLGLLLAIMILRSSGSAEFVYFQF